MNKGRFMSGCEANSVDKFSRNKRSEIMGKVRSRGNATTELAALRILRLGAITGWRRHLPILGRPDFTFPKNRIVLFIDGCFWHGCPRCYQAPKSSAAFWRRKLSKNQKRDKEVSNRLRRCGWRVVRVWECQLKSPAYLLRQLKKTISKYPIEIATQGVLSFRNSTSGLVAAIARCRPQKRHGPARQHRRRLMVARLRARTRNSAPQPSGHE